EQSPRLVVNCPRIGLAAVVVKLQVAAARPGHGALVTQRAVEVFDTVATDAQYPGVGHRERAADRAAGPIQRARDQVVAGQIAVAQVEVGDGLAKRERSAAGKLDLSRAASVRTAADQRERPAGEVDGGPRRSDERATQI